VPWWLINELISKVVFDQWRVISALDSASRDQGHQLNPTSGSRILISMASRRDRQAALAELKRTRQGGARTHKVSYGLSR